MLAQPSEGHRPPRWNSLRRSETCRAAARERLRPLHRALQRSMLLQRVSRRRDDHLQAPTSAVAGPQGSPQPRSGRSPSGLIQHTLKGLDEGCSVKPSDLRVGAMGARPQPEAHRRVRRPPADVAIAGGAPGARGERTASLGVRSASADHEQPDSHYGGHKTKTHRRPSADVPPMTRRAYAPVGEPHGLPSMRGGAARPASEGGDERRGHDGHPADCRACCAGLPSRGWPSGQKG